MTMRIAIIGAGGHARAVASIIRACAQQGEAIALAGFIAPERGSTPGWIGRDEDLADLLSRGRFERFILGIGSVRGGLGHRAAIFARLQPAAPAQTLIHPRATLADDVAISEGCAILPGAILNTGVGLAHNVIVNTGAIVDHDTQVGAHSHIAPGATLSGDIRVGEDVLVGVGASIRQGVTIGNGATIAAGAAVITDIEAGAVYGGVPARRLEQFS